MSKESKEYTNSWFAERGGKTWDKLLGDVKASNILEIGCYEGQASVWLLNKFPKAHLQVVDIFDPAVAEDWDGYINDYEKRFDNNVKEFGDRVKKYKGKSLHWLARAVGFDEQRYDIIFVDGDHRKLPATQDMALAIELLAPNGIMIIDDYAGIPWLFDAVNAFSNTLDSNVYSWTTTTDKEQFVIRRK